MPKFTSIVGYTSCGPTYIKSFLTIFGQCINVLNYKYIYIYIYIYIYLFSITTNPSIGAVKMLQWKLVTYTFLHHFAILQTLIVANSSTNFLFLDRMTFCGILCYSSREKGVLNFLLAFLVSCLVDPLPPGHHVGFNRNSFVSISVVLEDFLSTWLSLYTHCF